jgi:integrase/recombinase XerD
VKVKTVAWLETFLNEQHHLKETRKEVYRIAVKNFMKASGSDFKAVYNKIQVVHAALNLMSQHLAASTWNKQIVVYKRLARWLSDPEDDVCPPLWRKIKQKKIDWEAKLKYKWLTEAEFDRLLRVVDSQRDKALLATCVSGGLRAGELLSLRLRDIDAKGNELRVTVTGKTGTRCFVMNQFAPILKHWLNFHPLKNNPNAALWMRHNDGVASKYDNLSTAHVNRLLKKYAKRAGIDKPVALHWLRHSKVTWTAKDSTVKVTDKAANLAFGWSVNSNMYRHYTHLHGSDTDNLFRALDGVKAEKKADEHIFQRRACFNCNELNESGALFCFKCGCGLSEAEYKRQAEVKALNVWLLEQYRKDLLNKKKQP